MGLLELRPAELPPVCVLMCLLDQHRERVTGEGRGVAAGPVGGGTQRAGWGGHGEGAGPSQASTRGRCDARCSGRRTQSRASACGQVTVPLHALRAPLSALGLCVSGFY